jgi:hypothetical protein
VDFDWLRSRLPVDLPRSHERTDTDKLER